MYYSLLSYKLHIREPMFYGLLDAFETRTPILEKNRFVFGRWQHHLQYFSIFTSSAVQSQQRTQLAKD